MELKFKDVPGSWDGNDYPSVSMTSVSVGQGNPIALICMTHMNVDFDGAPNAYGPPDKETLDSLYDAGQTEGYYGIMSVHPTKDRIGNVPIKDAFNLQLDSNPAVADVNGRQPVIQKSGKYKGWYVSTTALIADAKATKYEQSHYVDSSAVAFHALSYKLSTLGVGGGDFGIAYRPDVGKSASFVVMEGEGHKKGTGGQWRVGECSYRVFLDIGFPPKTSKQKYANNNFATGFLYFPGSSRSPLQLISLCENAWDLVAFIGLQAQIDISHRGASGLPAYRKWMADGRKSKIPNADAITRALQPYGYNVVLSTLASVAGALLP